MAKNRMYNFTKPDLIDFNAVFTAAHKIFFFQEQVKGMKVIPTVSKETYEQSKKFIHNEVVGFVNEQLFESGEFMPHSGIVKSWVTKDSEDLIGIIQWLDEHSQLVDIFIKDGLYWPDFWRAKMILEKIEKDTNRHGGGRPSKLEKELDYNIESFCLDVDVSINKCLEDDKVNTWELAKHLVNRVDRDYVNYDYDTLNKFIKNTFDSKWLDYESSLNLSLIVKYERDYYLIPPKN